MNINIRIDKTFKDRYNKLCKACGANQTTMFTRIMGSIIAYCNLAEDELVIDDVKDTVKTLLYLLNIDYKEFNKLDKEG
jgi:hypothetical protein